MQYLIRTI